MDWVQVLCCKILRIFLFRKLLESNQSWLVKLQQQGELYDDELAKKDDELKRLDQGLKVCTSQF